MSETTNNIDKLILLLREASINRGEMEGIEKQLNSLHIANLQLSNRQSQIMKSVKEIMEYEDLKSPGNFGWENRIVTFMLQLVERTKP